MTSPIPKWLTRRYAILWEKFKEGEFTYEDAKNTLGDKEEVAIVVLSMLKKSEWIEIEKNPKDKRTKLYKLVAPEKAIMQIAKLEGL